MSDNLHLLVLNKRIIAKSLIQRFFLMSALGGCYSPRRDQRRYGLLYPL